ncbi:MAG: substrate-binding domain-containing protein [Planctomycetota bacterium]|jgi:phosphonate transport system substrate-binding protein
MFERSPKMNAKRRRNLILSVLFLLFIVIICVVVLSMWYRDKNPRVSFSDWVAVKPAKISNDTLRFAIASMVSAEETWVAYKELVDYVAERVGVKASMVLRPSYSDVRGLLEENKVDLAFVCTGTYIMCSREGTVELLAVPEFKNDLNYQCFFIVRADSAIKNIEDLRGKRFAFTDPESNTGCIVPTWAIGQYGVEPESYFGNIVYTGSHDRSIHAVADGVTDGAGVDSLVFYSLIKTHPDIKTSLRIIWKSEVFGAPPIVIPKGLEKSIKEKLCNIFLSMSEDNQGQKILEGLDVEYFREPRAGEYDSAYKIWKIGNGLK